MIRTRVLWADGVVTGDGAPLVDGAVVVDDGGVIVEVGAASSVLPRHAGASVERIRGVLLPGLVNAHTHVELSALRGQVPGGAGFVAWVERFIGARSELSAEDESAAIESAVLDLVRFGTVAVGDVTNSFVAVSALERAGVGGSVFCELFGTDRDSSLARVPSLKCGARAGVEARSPGDLAYGPAPHTLYTTHPDVVRALLARGREEGRLMSIHLAEHPAERRAIEYGDGPVVTWLRSRTKLKIEDGFWPRESLFSYADRLGVVAPDVLLVHLTDARPEELARVAEAQAPVVFCPRSNLYIETRLPPLLAALQAGIEPALGTDSLASNTSLDVLAEARALRERFPSVPAAALLKMATFNGARALRRADLGRLAKGARPGVLAIEGELNGDPAEFVLERVRDRRRLVVSRAKAGPAQDLLRGRSRT